MSILINSETRVLVQGITGFQGRFDTKHCLEFGTRVVAGVTPGRNGETVEGVPVFNTVRSAVENTSANAAVVYVPARGVADAVQEAVEAGIKVILATSENVPQHDASVAVFAARAADATLVGFNSNGLISPGSRCKLGGIGGDLPDQIYAPGRIGVCSRSGGMSAEVCFALKQAKMGVSTCVSMGGDPITGRAMVEYLQLFEDDPETDAMVIFGEPGSTHEQEVAEAITAGRIKKPVVALIAGEFQERYPKGVSFGHVAAMIRGEGDSASAKRKTLKDAGAHVAFSLAEIPLLLETAKG